VNNSCSEVVFRRFHIDANLEIKLISNYANFVIPLKALVPPPSCLDLPGGANGNIQLSRSLNLRINSGRGSALVAAAAACIIIY
jgi:hypothetical protein